MASTEAPGAVVASVSLGKEAVWGDAGEWQHMWVLQHTLFPHLYAASSCLFTTALRLGALPSSSAVLPLAVSTASAAVSIIGQVCACDHMPLVLSVRCFFWCFSYPNEHIQAVTSVRRGKREQSTYGHAHVHVHLYGYMVLSPAATSCGICFPL
jgi:hypothetical protein